GVAGGARPRTVRRLYAAFVEGVGRAHQGPRRARGGSGRPSGAGAARLVGRAGVDRGGRRRDRGGGDPRRGRKGRRRACDARSRRDAGAGGDRRVPAAGAGACRAVGAAQGGVRSARHPQSGPHVSGCCGMRTEFTAEQLADPQIATSNEILRKCVHCGFCTATCPTYVLLGDELDSPRGRIYLIKNMLEDGGPATGEVVKHVDRCLSCLACMTTCPASVDYMHLVDHARVHIEKTYRRPLAERLIRRFIAATLPEPKRARPLMRLGAAVRPLAPILQRLPVTRPLAAMLGLMPKALPPSQAALGPGVYAAEGERRARVALLAGCVQIVIAPHIGRATVRLLNRLGTEVVIPATAGCCGALVHHLGREDEAHAHARTDIDSWTGELDRGLDAVISD